MIRTIPTSLKQSWYEQTVPMDGTDFVLRIMWSERGRRWYCDMATTDGTVIRSGIKIVADRVLTERMSSSNRPAGDVWCVDRSGGGIDPDLRDLGARVVLLYVEDLDG